MGQKRGLCSDLSGDERKKGRLQVWRSNKYSAQYPWVLRWSLEKKRANLCIARGHFGAIISMKIVKTKAPLREKVWFPCMDKMSSLYKRTVSDVSQCGLCACGWSDLSPSGE